MRTRIGKVTNIYPSTGKVRVMYEDEGCASLPLSMLTMNQEYFMPAVGDRVVTMHMENGSSKGFVLGTYYGGGMQPRANAGYRKDFGGGAFMTCMGGAWQLSSGSASIKGGGASLNVSGDVRLTGANVILGSAAASDEDSEGDTDETEPDVYLKLSEETAELRAVTEVAIEADTTLLLKAADIAVEGESITLKCSYGTITVEDIIKRMERIEDELGLPHTV